MLPALAPAAADFTMTGGPTLPSGRFAPGSFAWGGYAYLAGAGVYTGGGSEQILRYDPATDALQLMGAKMPYGRGYSASVANETYAWIFGGKAGSQNVGDRIVRYDPAADRVSVAAARLPYHRERMGAAFDPRERPEAGCPSGCAYVFGGRWIDEDDGEWHKFFDVLRYDPAGDTLTVMASKLPANGPIMGFATIFDGRYVWLFGGQDASLRYRPDLLRYDPLTDEVQHMGFPLPKGRWGAAGAWVGDRGYVLGGHGVSPEYFDDIFRFDPGDGTNFTFTELDSALPSARWGMGPAVVGSTVVLLGGYSMEKGPLKEVVLFDPHLPPAPASTTAGPGTSPGEILVQWTPPAHDDAVTGYEVRRGEATGPLAVVATVGADARAWVDTTVPAGTTAYYRVHAVNAHGTGPGGARVGAFPAQAPSEPRGLVARAGPGPGEITLTWSAPASDGGLPIATYRVYAGDIPGSASVLAEVGPNLTFAETGLAAGTSRWYRVSAVNAAGESPLSYEVSASAPTVPGQPRGVRAETGLGLGRIDVRWGAPQSTGGIPIAGYEVWRGRSANSLTLVASLGPVSSWTDENRAHGVDYWYRIRALNAVGGGALSLAATGEAVGPGAIQTTRGEDGSWILFDDRDDDDAVDPGETLLVVPAGIVP